MDDLTDFWDLLHPRPEPSSKAPEISPRPRIPQCCRFCGSSLLMENLFMDDGCPCNSPKGVNFAPKHCPVCEADDCTKPGHRIPDLFGKRVEESFYTSPVFCEHANEVPHVCPCGPRCYCKANTCKRPV